MGSDLTKEDHNIDVSKFINNFANNNYDSNYEEFLTELINYKTKEELFSKTFVWKEDSVLEPLT